MMRKKGAEYLEPIKITKTEANYQALLLDMMSRLVSEQREGNRLLKKLAGESENELTPASSRGPKMPIFQSLHHKSMPVDMSLIYKSPEDQQSELNDNLSQIQHKHSRCHHKHDKQEQKAQGNLLSEKVIASIDNLGETMKRIEASLTVNLTTHLLSIQKQKKYEETEAKAKKDKLKQKQDQQKEQVKVKQSRVVQATKKKDQNFLQNGYNFVGEKKENKPENFKKGKGKNFQKRMDRLSAFDTFRIEKLLQCKQAQIKSSLMLNTENVDKKNYSILTHILPYSDKRELKIKIPLEEVMEYYKIKQINDEQEASTLMKHWLGNVYRATASICWNLLSNHELSLEEAKILFTENIIYNMIEFMKTVKAFQNNGNKINRCKIVEDINSTSVKILDFLCMQYPQTKVEDPNIALRNQIPSIDNKGEAEYDLISKVSQAKKVIFRRKENGNYTQQIMKTINYMIERSNEQFDRFKDMFGSIFGEIFLPIQKRRSTVKQEETHDDQLYYQKVKSYTKYLISQKINKNTPKYTEQQIQNGIFFVKSPSILRVITKWVEELDQIIRNPEQMIKNTQNQFKDHNGLSMYLYAQIKNGLFKQIRSSQQNFQNKVKHIKQECYHMQVLLALEMFTNDETQKFITREQTSVGKYCYYLKSAISSYICSELNEAIHFLLTIPSKVDETKIGITDQFYQEECRKDLINLNLIHFKIFDLLRCKCISKESEIVYLIRRLNEKSNDPSDPFKIIRIKDRLSNGTRDILINAQINKGIVCQIQLAVISNVDKKQQLLDQFNHFLYELKRAKLGPISENAAIWSTLEQRAGYFQSLIWEQQKQAKHGEIPHNCINVEKSQNNSVRMFTRPIICVSCNTFYEIPRTCLNNISCERCKRTYCGQCHFVHMSPVQRKQYLFQKHFRAFFPYLTEYQSFDKPIPKFGFLVRKFFLKKQLYYYRIISKNTDELNEKGKIDIEIIISVVENDKTRYQTINECPLQAELKNGQLFIKDKRYKEQFSNYIIYSIDISKELEKKSQNLADIFESFQKEKLKYINLLKQPAFIEDLKLIKRSKQIKKQSRQLKSILTENTVLTYLKLDKTVILAQIEVQQKKLHQELVKILNISKLKNYAIEKSFAVSMDFRQLTNEMSLIKQEELKYFTKELYLNFSKRVTKLYLNFGRMTEVSFLASFPNIKVLYLSSNCITSLAGVENLTNLQYICFDKNSVESLEPLANLTNLTQISGSENKITSLAGLSNLTKITVLTLYKNQISQIINLQNLKLKELSLNNNPIQKIESLNHMKDSLQQLYLGGSLITNFYQVYSFTGLKKLSLDGLHINKIDPLLLKGLDALTYLSLADNLIQKFEGIEAETNELIEINLKNNRLKEISGFEICNKLEILKLQHNFISNVTGIKGMEHLKVVYLQENPLEDCTDLYYFDNGIQLYFSKIEDNVDPLYVPKASFYQKYDLYEKHKAASSSGNNEDSEIQDQ